MMFSTRTQRIDEPTPCWPIPRIVPLRTTPPFGAPDTRCTTVTSADTVYLDRVRSVIEQNLGDESFGVAQLAQAVGQDRSHLYRRIHTLLDETPSNLLRRLRLERASQLLAGHAGTVAEIAYAVGFNSVSYFCKCFREKHGVTPSGFRGSKREG